MELYYRSVNIFDEKIMNEFSLEHLDSGTQILAGDASLISGKSYHEYDSFYKWYKCVSELDLDEVKEKVGCSVYLVFNKENDYLIGIFDIRHSLDYPDGEILGHIGVDIRPSMRGKGLYKEILKLCIQKCENFNIKDIVISCEYDNITSMRGIEHHFSLIKEMVPCNGSYLFVYKKSL